MFIIYLFVHSRYERWGHRTCPHYLNTAVTFIKVQLRSLVFYTFLLFSTGNANDYNLLVPTNARIVQIHISPYMDNLASADPSGRAL